MLKQKFLLKKRTSLEQKLNQLRTKKKQLRADEEELQAKIDALEDVTPELEQQVADLEQQQTETDDAIAEILDDLDAVKAELDAIEDGEPDQDEGTRSVPGPAAARTAAPAAAAGNYVCRSRCFTSRQQRDEFYSRRSMKVFLDGLRSLAGSGRRSVKGAELNIPEEMLDLMRDNLGDYSKLISKIRLRPVRGKARQNVTGKVPDGIWTEAVGALNELDFAFTQIEVDGYKVGGYIPLDNSTMHDSDIDLGEEVMTVLLYAIGQGVDKAIVYGTGTKMPVGIITRLAQTSQPAYWGTNQGTWTDLHSTNVLKLNLGNETGVAFFKPLLAAMGKAKPNYTDGESFWVMNRTTHLDLMARALNFNASGALVAGMDNRMPLEGGEIVEVDWMPDYEIVGGFGDAYLLVEREGGSIAQSEHVRFIEDQTVFKGTARYDGQPAIGEAFVVVNYNNTNVTTSYAFGEDYANTAMNVLICTAAQGAAAGKTVVTVSGAVAGTPALYYAVANSTSFNVGDKLPSSGWNELTSGTTAITAAAGAPISVVELDSDDRVVSFGSVLSVPKAS